MKIRFVLSSFVEGNSTIHATIEVSTENLAHSAGQPDEGQQLQAEVAAADVFHLADNLTRKDGIQYELTVEDGDRKHTTQSNNAATSPDALKPLLAHLIELQRATLARIASEL